jgi:hypothetical protein
MNENAAASAGRATLHSHEGQTEKKFYQESLVSPANAFAGR